LDKALVIASIDFSHYVSEETALKNDQRTQDWLLDWDEGLESADFDDSWGLEKTFVMDSKKGTAMDSPETFYVFTSLLGKVKEVEIWNRTSSASLTGEIDPLQNTSHIFVKVW